MTRRRFILLLVLAMVATVGSAWVPAGLDVRGPMIEGSHSTAPWTTGRFRWLLSTRSVQRVVAENVPPPVPADPAAVRHTIRGTPLTPGAPGSVTWSRNAAFSDFCLDEWGFPVRCMWAWEAQQLAPGLAGPAVTASPSGGAFELSIAGQQRLLPYTPIWFGIVANAVFYFVAFAGFIAARRCVLVYLRTRRGLCGHCLYDLRATPRGLPCPECGRARAR
ncbi:MAG: hypothetical protein ACK4WH_15025 [Phycisphaerales bacterium]